MALYRKKINLGKEIKAEEIQIKQDKDGKTFPSFYVYGIKLPLTAEDISKKMKAEITLVLSGVTQNNNKNGSNFNYDFEIKEIMFI